MTRPNSIEDLNVGRGVRELNHRLFSEPTAPTPHGSCSKVESELEKKLQDQVEAWLHHRGYWHRSSKWISKSEKPERGWIIHLHVTKKNPLLLDVLLLGNDGRYTEFELKRPHGRYTSESQRILCESHGLPKFETFEEVVAHVQQWEQTP